MPEILIKYADEMIVGVFCLWGIRLNRTENIFLGAKAPLCEKRIRELFVMLIRRCKARSRSGHLS